jgi:KUP system potassium uptake protein
VFLVIDVAFFASNLLKVLSSAGALVPIAIGAFVFTIMVTWKRGRAALGQAMFDATLPLDAFHADLQAMKPHRVKGTAVFMSSNPDAAPPVLLHHFKHNKVLHEQVVCLSIMTAHQPEVSPDKRIEVLRDLGDGVYQVKAVYGFMQTPSALEILQRCAEKGLATDLGDTSFFLGRETLVMTDKKGMTGWRKSLFAYLSRNARPATSFFQIPPNRVVEFGMQVEL